MFIDKNTLSVTAGGITRKLGNYITSAKFGYNKVWADDSGRNLAGEMSGTLIGIFPKIIVTFGPLTKTQLEEITPILDSVRQNLTYYDPTKQANVTMQTYTGDYEVTNNNIIQGNATNESFEVSFISVKKRV